MFKFIQDHKWKAVVSSILILSPSLVGVLMWDELPSQMITHFGGDGVADGTSSKIFAVFGLPIIVLALHWAAILITCFDKNNRNQNRKAIGLVFWILPIISILVESVTLGIAMGKEINFEFFMTAPIALLFVAFGNYMPKISQNSTFGIKLPWTLASEENWNMTHRLGGKVWVVCGFVILISMMLPMELMIVVMVGAMVVAAVVPTVYSYMMFKKQKSAGGPISTKVNFSKKSGRIAIIFTVVILVAVGVLMLTGDINVEFEDEGFNIEASYWDDLYVAYDDIKSCELRDSDNPGTRSSGYGSPQLSMGTFENSEFGRYTRYTYTGEDSCIVLSDGNEVLVLGGASAEDTKAIYEELVERIG